MEVTFEFNRLQQILNETFVPLRKDYDIVCLKIDESFCVIWSKSSIYSIVDKLLRVYWEEKKFIAGVGVKIVKKDKCYYDTFELNNEDFYVLSNAFFKMLLVEFQEINSKIYQNVYNPKKTMDNTTALSFIETLGTKFSPMEHQLNCFINSINEKKLTNQSATSSGKSFIIYLLCQYMIARGDKTIIVVPNISLLKQMENDFLSYGWKDEHIISKIGGSNEKVKQQNFSVVITTWQSLVKETFPYDISEFNCCIVDECHMLRNNGNILKEFLLPRAAELEYRFGFSGTIPNNPLLRYNIVSFCGEVNDVIDVKKLISENKAVNIDVKVVRLSHNRETYKDALKQMSSNQSRYALECAYLENSQKRNDYIIDVLVKLKNRGNVLCLHKSIDFGFKMLYLTAQHLLQEKNIECIFDESDYTLTRGMKKYIIFTQSIDAFIKCNRTISPSLILSGDELGLFYINGNTLGDRREYIRNVIQERNNCVLFGTYQCMSTGVNIPNLNTLMYIQSMKSEIVVNQSIGRMLRKSQNKNKAMIVDVVDIFNKAPRPTYSEQHFLEREKIYKTNKFQISYIDRQL